MLTWITIALAAWLLIRLVLSILRWRRQPVVVLGTQMAAAEEHELAHREKHPDLVSPLAGKAYDGSATLFDPVAVPFDDELRAMLPADAAGAQAFRDAATTDDFYTLMLFAQRAATFALMRGDRALLESALRAVAMIETQRVDFRDVIVTLELLDYVAHRLKLPAIEMFEAVAPLAEPETAATLRAKPRRTAHDSAGLWLEVPGHGFAEHGFGEHYAPTRDLVGPAAVIREELLRNDYPGQIQVADSLEGVQFPRPGQLAAEKILKRARAVVSVLGRRGTQWLDVSIVETRSEEEAATLAALATDGPAENPVLALHEGPLFLFAVQSSLMSGEKTIETPQSLQRFAEPFRRALTSS